MKKFVLLLVALGLVVGMSSAAWAEHTVLVLDGGGDPEANVWVRIHVYQSSGWAYIDVQTDNMGIATDITLIEAATAAYWWAEIIDSQFVYDSEDEDYPIRETTLNTDPL